MKNYLGEIKKFPVLSREEERELMIKAKAGDERARERLIKCNLRFVVSVARRYKGQGLPMEDLISEGNYGLIQALDKYDIEFENKFITYAVWWIRHYIFQAINTANAGTVRMPINRQQIINKSIKLRDKMMQELQREPTIPELEKELGMSLDGYYNGNHNYFSFEDESSSGGEDNERTLEERFADDRYDIEQIVEERNIEADVEELLSNIEDERERMIIRYYHGLNLVRSYTLEEIGSFFGISRERVRQIKEKILERIANNPKYQHLKQHIE